MNDTMTPTMTPEEEAEWERKMWGQTLFVTYQPIHMDTCPGCGKQFRVYKWKPKHCSVSCANAETWRKRKVS